MIIVKKSLKKGKRTCAKNDLRIVPLNDKCCVNNFAAVALSGVLKITRTRRKLRKKSKCASDSICKKRSEKFAFCCSLLNT